MALSTGDSAPTVSAQNQDGEAVSPDFAEPTVVYFYPRDGTPGCQLEANQFQAELDSYRDAGMAVYGVSTDNVDSHREFADDNGLEFDLLADPAGEVAAAFDLEVSDDFVGRTTFVLADDEVKAVYDPEDVNPDGHARARYSPRASIRDSWRSRAEACAIQSQGPIAISFHENIQGRESEEAGE